NSKDNLLVEGELGDITELKERAIEFLTNPYNKEDLPEKETKEIDLIGSIKVTKGVISLRNDRGTSYEMYIKVQNELAAAINELRNNLAMEQFGLKFKKLTDERQIKAIQKAIPIAISEAEPEDIGGN
ncbi:MAG: biopolymer transporter ExbD, partial [Bacteroidales bacterium]|nr:biopolymer transporter ExbD [Bacteroidales bacterium]